MRYLLATSLAGETTSRINYLQEIFHLYFIPRRQQGDNFISLLPVGTVDPSILFIAGHNWSVYQFLHDNGSDLPENTLVLITCISREFRSVLPKHKTIFATNPLSGGSTPILNGYEFNFGFDISEAELKFYNNYAVQNIQDRLSMSFYQIK